MNSKRGFFEKIYQKDLVNEVLICACMRNYFIQIKNIFFMYYKTVIIFSIKKIIRVASEHSVVSPLCAIPSTTYHYFNLIFYPIIDGRFVFLRIENFHYARDLNKTIFSLPRTSMVGLDSSWANYRILSSIANFARMLIFGDLNESIPTILKLYFFIYIFFHIIFVLQNDSFRFFFGSTIKLFYLYLFLHQNFLI